MSYEVHVLPSAERDMEKLTISTHDRISKRVLGLEENPRPKGVKKLSGREEYRIRVGDYRVLYTINDKKNIIIISAIAHRRDVYR